MSLSSQARAAGLDPSRLTYQGRPLDEIPDEQPRAKLPPKRKDLADTFEQLWKRLGPHEKYPLVREFRFCPERRFRFDCAWPEHKVAVECEGGLWVTSRHRSGLGYHRDMQKYNLATRLGWKLLRFAANDLDLNPLQTIEQVTNLLESRP